MTDDRRNYLLVGAFVAVMLAAGVFWIATLAGRTGATDDYFTVYTNVLGLGPGTQVYYEGYPIGVIDGITPMDDAGAPRFRVDVSVQRGWRIPEDSEARITASGFLSALVIDIASGRSPTPLSPGDRIRSVEAASVLDVVSDVADEIQALSRDSLRPILDEIGHEVPEILTNLRSLSQELVKSVEGINALLSPENADRVEVILAELSRTTEQASALAGDLRSSRTRLDGVLGTLQELLDHNRGDLDHTLADLHYSLESIAAHVDAISRNLETTTRNASEFSRQLRENPAVLLRGRANAAEDGR